ncbi:heme-binding protein [Mucilaginibacter phyllosphaerae]|uniref:Uncharacterized protein n=1 Tax=Mucilaginibacter phyllosphaerae TaxID=1812349 RepID=A0A4Y8AK09_9SPHI|nr:heme-binding protein [Mucilaginibacter phyllosphaerae]MBB3968120.1 hypothetical protein [Mucilaginibacter phyllosphaerae]TEW68861.1 hypothetical protein E2R65_01475 [Mucilaginibacter phyllosphaerae]GGH01122.1 hypothetical protein GCM10007352_02690 [Mucilaginibacter phyllosphaerae]
MLKDNSTNLPKGFVRLGGSETEIASKLGPLAGLAGTWRGNLGWNMIAVPSNTGTVKGFKLLIQNYSETITFTPISAPVPNRGGEQMQSITGLMYDLTITDNATEGILHLENGMWLYMADVQKQPDKGQDPFKAAAAAPDHFYTIVRQASIPHGDVVVALGDAATSNGMPAIPPVQGHPIDFGTPPNLGYLDQYTHTGFPLNQFNTQDPNASLRNAIAGQNIGNVTVISVDTQVTGGAIVNIPFVQQTVDPTRFVSTYWIEDVTLADGTQFKQLQYSQQADLNFIPKFPPQKSGTIMWPHINVNTLRKQ